MRRLALLTGGLVMAVALPAQAFAATTPPKTDPTKEFLLTPWIAIPKIGPIDLSITKGVFYLILSTAILLIVTLAVARHLQLRPKRLQAFVEILYDFSETQIGRASLPAKMYGTWFPYLATLFLFIWINNIISYVPLPVDTEHKIWGWLPTPTFYASTSNLSVTLALTLVTFFATHYVGIRENGAVGYFKSWFPPVSGAINILIVPLEILSQFLRLVSLSVRLFANMLAGHLLVLMCISLIIIIGNVFVAAASIPVAVFFYCFELVLVANLQAFIFALLSGIYIGTAGEPHH
ncbi:MAG TPA: F0F1 ATP synthase subunit A [Gaiellales bacterium]|jgi:F-type H+-transporting ATPase subunit a|nr:F0F1 ATP synthase subunit A [Gaiellales bacterium]